MDTREWLAYFQWNARNNLALAEPDEHVLTEEERARIETSIQAFQIGEASEGRTLQRLAEAFAVAEEDPAYAEAVRLFIREENRHSGYLRVFMQEHGLPRAKAQWSDGIFRFIRKLAGLELSIRVLVTAEMIAIVYYAALAAATGSRKLAVICRRMLAEERMHVRFQMGTVARLKARRPAAFGTLADWLHGALMAVTTVVVWWDHRTVLRASHPRYVDFFRAAWTVLQEGLSETTRPADARSEEEEVLCARA